MAKNLSIANLAALKAAQLLVQDHGDALRWSVSKRGRIWLTFTHWDTEKYNTSVELDAFAQVSDFMSALGVLCMAHYIKCFKGGPHDDTWLSVASTAEFAADGYAYCTDVILSAPSGGEGGQDPTASA